MGRLIKNILFIFVIFLGMVAVLMMLPGDETGFIFSDIDKLERLEELPSPKIILVGGSNVAMGYDSEMLERELKMPVVNMGLHAGLGLRFLFERVRDHVHEGDIVIISPEYENFFYDFYNGLGPIIAGTIASLPDHAWFIRSYSQASTLTENINSLLNSKMYNFYLLKSKEYNFGKAALSDEKIYYRKAFNKWGDIVSHLNTKSPGIVSKEIPDFSTRKENDDVFGYLSEINDYVTSRGGKVFFSFPMFAESAYAKNKKNIEFIYRKLKNHACMTIIDAPEDREKNDRLFFDNYYHLNAEGRIVNTRSMITSLKKSLKRS